MKFAWRPMRKDRVFAWQVALGIALTFLFALLVYAMTSGAGHRARAVEAGQRVTVTVASVPAESVPPAAPETQPPAEPVPEPVPEAPDTRSPAARIPPQPNPDVTVRDLPPVPTVEASGAALSEANPALQETVPAGVLPKIGSDGLTPSRYYARPFTAKGKAPRLAVLVPDLGQSVALTEAALRLPPEVSLAFSPYGRELSTWNANARKLGHETYLQLPLSTQGTEAGPLALPAGKDAAAVKNALHAVMAKLPAVAGLYAPKGEQFSWGQADRQTVWGEGRARGLLLLCAGGASGFRRAIDAAPGFGLCADRAYGRSDMVDWAKEWPLLETLARERGTLFVVIEPTPAALAALAEWLKTLAPSGLTLAPVSALVPAERVAAPPVSAEEAGKDHGEKVPERHNPALEDGEAKKESSGSP